MIRERRARAARSNRRGDSGRLCVPGLPSSSQAVRNSSWGRVSPTLVPQARAPGSCMGHTPLGSLRLPTREKMRHGSRRCGCEAARCGRRPFGHLVFVALLAPWGCSLSRRGPITQRAQSWNNSATATGVHESTATTHLLSYGRRVARQTPQGGCPGQAASFGRGQGSAGQIRGRQSGRCDRRRRRRRADGERAGRVGRGGRRARARGGGAHRRAAARRRHDGAGLAVSHARAGGVRRAGRGVGARRGGLRLRCSSRSCGARISGRARRAYFWRRTGRTSTTSTSTAAACASRSRPGPPRTRASSSRSATGKWPRLYRR